MEALLELLEGKASRKRRRSETSLRPGSLAESRLVQRLVAGRFDMNITVWMAQGRWRPLQNGVNKVRQACWVG